MRLLVHAPNIHTGGGAVLLNALLEGAQEAGFRCTVFLDERMRLNPILAVKEIRVAPLISQRVLTQGAFRRESQFADFALCFGNLPPVSRLFCPSAVYVQSRILLPGVGLKWLSRTQRIRLRAERLWLGTFLKNVDEIWVQSPEMKKAAEVLRGKRPIPVVELPFASNASLGNLPKVGTPSVQDFDFLYVSSGDSYKNHLTLLSAWEKLGERGLFPRLALTLDPQVSSNLLAKVEGLAKSGLRITNFSKRSHQEVLELYDRSKALIFPSLMESLGLPLVEAAARGIPILASNLSYVRDLVKCAETFAPLDADAIGNAVESFTRRIQNNEFMGSHLVPVILTPQQFVAEIKKRADVLKHA